MQLFKNKNPGVKDPRRRLFGRANAFSLDHMLEAASCIRGRQH